MRYGAEAGGETMRNEPRQATKEKEEGEKEREEKKRQR